MDKRLMTPDHPFDMILDTDAYNEIDDQFAISYMIRSPEKITVKAITAAPFFNPRCSSPEEGMELSYQEILKLLDLAEMPELKSRVYRGSTTYLPDENTPVESQAARKIVEISRDYSPETPLYVAAIGCITNVASALLLDPSLAERIIVVWLGGKAFHYCDRTEFSDNSEFNLSQDVAAARVVVKSPVPLVLLPCAGVVDHCTTTEFELRHWLGGKNPLADYLTRNTIAEAESYAFGRPWSRVIWDITTIAWLLNDSGKLMKDKEVTAPLPGYDNQYDFSYEGKKIGYVYEINRDRIFEDLFTRLTRRKGD